MNTQSLKSTKQSSKNAYYVLEKTRQQLELRKQFLNRYCIPEERTLFTQENPQQYITFNNARATIVLDKQANEKKDKEKKDQTDESMFQNEETVDKYQTDFLLPMELLLPTVTSGESSPNESDEESSSSRKSHKQIPTSTSLDDVLSYMIDSSLLSIDRDHPSNQRGSSSNGRSENPNNFYWGNISELLFLNIDVQLSSATIKHDIRSKFNSLPFIFFESMRTFYYHGKYSLLITLSNEKQAQKVFEYFRNNSQSFRNLLGDRLELYRVTVNNLNNPTRNNTKKTPLDGSQNTEPQIGQQQPGCWIPIILRNLPGYFDKSNFQRLLHMVALQPSAIKSVEEPILLNQKKHCMALLSDVDSAFTLISKLPLKLREFPLFRINLHPAYTKQSWRIRDTQENPYCRFYEKPDDAISDQHQESYSKTNQHFQFQKYFLEDISIIHKSFKQLRPEYLNQKEEEDLKKLSQRSTTPIYHHNSLDLDCQEQTVSLNTPSAMFHPSNNNFCENNLAAEDLAKSRSIHTIGYSSPSDKQRIAEFTAPVNRSPDRGKKHRRRTVKDQSSNVEEQLSNSSPVKQQNFDNEKKINENDKEQKVNQDNLEIDKGIIQEKSNQNDQEIGFKSPQQNNNSHKKQDQDQIDDNKLEDEEQLHELRQKHLNNLLREERKPKYKSRIQNKRTSSTSSSKSSYNRESSSSNSSSSSSSSQERTQKDKKDRKKKKNLRSTSRNNKSKSFSKRSHKLKDHYKKGSSIHKKDKSKRKSDSKHHESTQSAEKQANQTDEQKHYTIKQRITLQNQEKLDQNEKVSSRHNSRSRSRGPETDEEISSPKNRSSQEKDHQQKDKISIENTKTGYQGQRYQGKNSEERYHNDKRNNSIDGRYQSRHSNNYQHNYSHNNNYKYRDMRRGRHYSNNDSRMHSPTQYRYQNQYQQRLQEGYHKRSISYADKYPKSKDQTYHKNNSQDSNNSSNQGNNEEKTKGYDGQNRNNKNRHSRSNSPQRFKHPRSFNSKYN